MRKLWVIMPVFRDAESFAWVRAETARRLAESPAARALEAVFVGIDDTGGLDGDLAGQHDGKRVEIVPCPYNMGHQRAIVFGIRAVADRFGPGDIVLTMDSDGQDRPEDVAALVSSVLDGESAGSRLTLARRTERRESLGFRVLYFFFKLTFRVFTGTVVRTGNFAAYPASLIRRAITHPYFDLSYSSALLNLGFPIAYVRCPRGERHAGESRMSLTRLINHGIRMMMPFLDKVAVRLILFVCALTAAGIAVFGGGLYLHVARGWAVPGWVAFLFAAALGLSVVALLNFLVLFALFSFSPLFSFRRRDRDGSS